MKDSELYHLAEIAVLECGAFSNDVTLSILKILMADEDTALFVEKREAQENDGE